MSEAQAKQNIVFVLSGYGRHARGAERLVEDLVVRLSGRYNLRVLGGGADAPGAVPLEFWSRDLSWTNRIQRTPGLGHASRLFQLDPLNWEWLTCALAARRWLLRNPCDLLVPEGGRWGGWLGCWARRRLGIPFVDIAHGAPSRWEVAAARCRPDCYVAPTLVAAQAMAAAVPGLNVRIIPPGVDTQRFCPEGVCTETNLPSPVVIAVGALEPLKRMDLVVRAVKAWGRGSLLLVGDGPQREALAKLGMEWLGPERFRCRTATADEMPALYRSADLLVSASRNEAFGMVYLEALACGLPVVSRDDPVRREVLGSAAKFAQTEDPAEWASRFEEALAGTDRLAFREQALKHDIHLTELQYGDLFDSLLGECRRNRSPA
jgi:glycosyltransferase involved in cell wall biosynthesis